MRQLVPLPECAAKRLFGIMNQAQVQAMGSIQTHGSLMHFVTCCVTMAAAAPAISRCRGHKALLLPPTPSISMPVPANPLARTAMLEHANLYHANLV